MGAIKSKALWLGVLFLLAACGGGEEHIEVPTLRVLATFTPSVAPSATATTPPSATPTSSQTATRTATPSPTPSNSPTASTTPSATLSPTASVTPIAGVVISDPAANLRYGPGVEYDVVGEIFLGQGFEALAYATSNYGDTWYLIRTRDGHEGWVSALLVRLTNATQVAQAATIPPTFTPSPTASMTNTPRPTATATLPQGANARVSGEQGLNLREGAGYRYAIIDQLETHDPLVIIGRNRDASWYQVVTFQQEAQAGWVLARLVAPLVEANTLAITWTGEDFARIVGLECGMNIQPRDGQGWQPIPPDLAKTHWVRFPFTSSRHHFPNLAAAFAYFDPIISSYNRLGVKVLLVLTHQTYGEAAGYDFGNMSAAQWRQYGNSFATTAASIAAHYGEQVAAYEVWNEGDAEPDNPAAISISPAAYAHLLDETARAIRRAAPQARVVLGGLLGQDAVYMGRVLRALNGRLPVDAIAVHPYAFGAPDDDTVFSWLGDITDFIQAYNRIAPDVPLWLTEVGATGQNDAGYWLPAATYMDNLIAYLRAQYSGLVEVVIWYAWSDAMHPDQRVNGLVTVDNQPKDPLYNTFFRLCGR